MSRFQVLLIVFFLSAAPVAAVDAVSIVLDTVTDTVTITRVNGQVKVYDYSGFLPLDAPDLAAAKDELQDFYDAVVQRNSLPSDDPDRLADPANECSHWTGPGNRIVSRNTVVVEITTDANGDPVVGLRNCKSGNPPL